jgi:ribonuclease HII
MNSLKKFDNNFIEGTVKLLAGTDEAGRGPIAGPVVAAAVIFDDKTFASK